jgi:hypothetical protein
MSLASSSVRFAILALIALTGIAVAVPASAWDQSAADAEAAAVPLRARVVFAGITPSATTMTTSLQFVNVGKDAGTAIVTVFDSASGTELATWTSASVPSFGSLQVSSAEVVGAATPALTTSQTGPFDFEVTGTIKGNVQLIGVVAGLPVNLSDCGDDVRGRLLGSVAGPGNMAFADAIGIVNDGDQAATVTLTLYDGTSGSQLGVWTSPSVPPHGSLTTAVSAIAVAANPIVPATTTLLTITAADEDRRLVLQHLSQPESGGAVTDVTLACHLRPTPEALSDGDRNTDAAVASDNGSH